MNARAAPFVVFRADASTRIGSGHVMRCLALAKALGRRGARCHFLMRDLPGHLGRVVHEAGIGCTLLDAGLELDRAPEPGPESAACAAALLGERAGWLVVDHYAIDARWERALRAQARRLLVIDDLADRAHDADLLLDQNLGRCVVDYAGRLPASCRVLVGPSHALLRDEFALRRSAGLRPRGDAPVRRLLVSLGGANPGNVTGAALEALARCSLPPDLRVTVVMGAAAAEVDAVRAAAGRLPVPCELRVDVRDMADVLAEADLAIGAAGHSAWERCCLGLPSLLVTLADNQAAGARALAAVGAAESLGPPAQAWPALPAALAACMRPERLRDMAAAAAAVTDGRGVDRVVDAMEFQHA